MGRDQGCSEGRLKLPPWKKITKQRGAIPEKPGKDTASTKHQHPNVRCDGKSMPGWKKNHSGFQCEGVVISSPVWGTFWYAMGLRSWAPGAHAANVAHIDLWQNHFGVFETVNRICEPGLSTRKNNRQAKRTLQKKIITPPPKA